MKMLGQITNLNMDMLIIVGDEIAMLINPRYKRGLY
jgi:hypothetical protein